LAFRFLCHAGPQARCFAYWGIAVSYWQQRELSGAKNQEGGKKSHPEPKLLALGSAKTAIFALQKIHFSNDRFWRNADIGPTGRKGGS
jgi:hypothetical protein